MVLHQDRLVIGENVVIKVVVVVNVFVILQVNMVGDAYRNVVSEQMDTHHVVLFINTM